MTARLPLAISQRLGSTLGWVASFLPIRPCKITDINLRLCLPELSPEERLQLRRKTLREVGKLGFESGYMWFNPAENVFKQIRKISGAEILEEAYQQGKGILAMFPHLGCWELAGLYCSARYPITALYKPQKPQLDKLIRESRSRVGATLVPTNKSGVKACLKALMKKEMVMILPDQDAGRKGGIYVDFFGHPANTPPLLTKLAHKTGAPIVIIYAERLPPGKGYHLHIRKASHELYNADLKTALSAMNKDVETCIRNLPEQYLWTYKRFRFQPEGYPNLY